MSFVEGEITVEFGGTVGPAGPAGNAVPIASGTVLANPSGVLANPVGVDAAGMRTLIDAEQAVVDCTKAPYNCDPTGVADATTGLNSFFAYVSANNVGMARCNGTFKISGTINVGPASGDIATKVFQGSMTLNCTGTFETAILLRKSTYISWHGIVVVNGVGGTAYNTRTVTTGVILRGVNHSQFDGFWITQMLGDALVIDSAGGDFTYDNTITDVFAIDCGSTGVAVIDLTTVLGTWSNRSDSGSSGGFDQLSTITVTNLPPATTDSILKTILIGGNLYNVVSMNRGASTVTLFPWIAPVASSSGSYKFIFGSGIKIIGAEVAGNTIHHTSSIRTGNGLSVESLYGPTIGVLQTQAVGVGLSVGSAWNTANLGTAISRYYGEELNEYHFLLKTLSAKCVNVDSMTPVEAEKMRICCAPTVGPWNIPNPTYAIMGGCSFGMQSGLSLPNKPINNSETFTETAFLDVGTHKLVGYYADNFNVQLQLSESSVISRLGLDTFSFTVFGSGANGQPNGTITVTPPSGWKINGGAVNANATFSTFSGPATIRGYLQLSTLNIVVGKTFNIADNAVTYAKMQDVSAASRLVGRGSAGGAGDPQEITLGNGLTMNGTVVSTLNLTKAGAISDADFPVEPADGTIAVDTTYGRLYFRSGGVWEYIEKNILPVNMLVNSEFRGAVAGTPGTGPTTWTREVEGTITTAVSLSVISATATSGRFILQQSFPLVVGTYLLEAYVSYLSGTAVAITDLLFTNSSGTLTYFVDGVETLSPVGGASKLNIRIVVASPHTAAFYLGVGLQGAATRGYSVTNPSLRKIA